MTEGYLGEIRMIPIHYTPVNWTPCYGQLLAIAGLEDVYSVVGTTYGGDGRTNFGVPDLRGRIPLHRGTGPGLTPRTQGEMFGTEMVTLTIDQIPNHKHTVMAANDTATTEDPTGAVFSKPAVNAYVDYISGREKTIGDAFVQTAGSGGPHSNMMPFMVTKFFMCIKGIYPQRS